MEDLIASHSLQPPPNGTHLHSHRVNVHSHHHFSVRVYYPNKFRIFLNDPLITLFAKNIRNHINICNDSEMLTHCIVSDGTQQVKAVKVRNGARPTHFIQLQLSDIHLRCLDIKFCAGKVLYKSCVI